MFLTKNIKCFKSAIKNFKKNINKTKSKLFILVSINTSDKKKLVLLENYFLKK